MIALHSLLRSIMEYDILFIPLHFITHRFKESSKLCERNAALFIIAFHSGENYQQFNQLKPANHSTKNKRILNNTNNLTLPFISSLLNQTLYHFHLVIAFPILLFKNRDRQTWRPVFFSILFLNHTNRTAVFIIN